MAVKNVDNYGLGDGFGSPLNIRRGNPNPLDNSEIWADVASATKYAATDPTAYVGQVISYFYTDASTGEEKVRLAQIIDSQGTLRQILGGGDSMIDIDVPTVTEKDIDDMIFAVFGK